MLIRPYTPADRLSCIAIFNSNCPAYLDPTEINGLENWLNSRDKGTIAYKNSAADFFYVLENNNTVIACGGFYIVKDKQQANMTWGMVNNLYHKQGYGKQLFQYRMEQIKKRYPQHSIVLDTSQHTYPFFEQFGFTVTHIIPDAYGPGLDRYDMINKRH